MKTVLHETAFRVEGLLNEALQIRSSNLAIHEAIFNGHCSVKEYEWAFHALFVMTCNHENDLQKLTDDLFKELRKEEK